MLIRAVSTLLSGVIDNIPYVATMSPLALGADFDGNKGAQVTLLTVLIAAPYPWLRYFVA